MSMLIPNNPVLVSASSGEIASVRIAAGLGGLIGADFDTGVQLNNMQPTSLGQVRHGFQQWRVREPAKNWVSRRILKTPVKGGEYRLQSARCDLLNHLVWLVANAYIIYRR